MFMRSFNEYATLVKIVQFRKTSQLLFRFRIKYFDFQHKLYVRAMISRIHLNGKDSSYNIKNQQNRWFVHFE